MRLLPPLCAFLAASGFAFSAETARIITGLMNDGPALENVPFAEVVRAATGKQVLPVNPTDTVDHEILAKIGKAMDEVLRKLNATNHPAQTRRRINEVSALFEAAMKAELSAIDGFECDYPKLAFGARQRAGYPDLRLVDRKSKRVLYLDPKLFESGSRASSLRTFYFEPKRETNKILDDAHHLIVGFEHDGKADGTWKFLSWELIDLANFRVKLKAEFQASNRDVYRPEAVVASSRTNSSSIR